jgi:glycosyltransferase involved in cell wall biosynthesis
MPKVPLHIVVYTPVYYPTKGGVEKILEILVGCWRDKGHRVSIITPANPDTLDTDPEVYRNCTPLKIRQLISSADIYILNVFTWKGFIPSIGLFKPVVAIHHTYYTYFNKITLSSILKKGAMHFVKNIAVSKYVLDKINVSGVVIYNTYQNEFFFNTNTEREGDFIFVGRLVSDKGCLEMMKAFIEAKKKGDYSLTVIGDGPEKEGMIQLAQGANILSSITFLGALEPPQIAAQLNKHKVMLVPSVWEEPFGIVALEGMACGCQIVASTRGGLPEAVGDLGYLADPSSPVDFANKMIEAIQGEMLFDQKKSYIQSFEKTQIAQRYLDQFDVWFKK